MHTFKTKDGQSWDLDLTLGSVRRVRDRLKDGPHGDVDLLNLEEGEPALGTRLATDLMLLCDILWILVEREAAERGITDEQFGELLGGGDIAEAHETFFKELMDFFQKMKRPDRVNWINKQQETIRHVVEKISSKVSEVNLTSKIDSTIDKQFMKFEENDLIPGETSSDSEESLE